MGSRSGSGSGSGSRSVSPGLRLPSPTWEGTGCSVCGCWCSRLMSPAGRLMSPAGRLSMKRKLDEMVETPQLELLHLAAPSVDGFARVEKENECLALRQALASQHQMIHELQRDLEEERNASSSATSEAMSMILRLQREKAEIQMDARQFKQFVEEKMAHDQQEILTLEDACYRREQTIQALVCEVQVYKHRLMSYGIDPGSDSMADTSHRDGMVDMDGGNADGSGTPGYSYPPVRCFMPDGDMNDEFVEKYAAGDTPRTPGSSTREHLQHIEQRISQMESKPGSSHFNVVEKVIVGNSPRFSRHARRLSTESVNSFLAPEIVQECGVNGKHHGEYSGMLDHLSDVGADDMSDRVYTIDAIHGIHPAPSTVGGYDDYASSPRGSIIRGNAGSEEADIKKLYTRLQALEADRESLKQAIISMRTEKAQMVLLKEIAENLSKGMAVPQPTPLPEKILTKKPSWFGSFWFMPALKWVISFAFWTKKTNRCKYMFRFSDGQVGLLLLLDKSQHTRKWRCVTRPMLGC